MPESELNPLGRYRGRVRLVGKPSGVTNEGSLKGFVKRVDPNYSDHLIIQLDFPAIYEDKEELPEVTEHNDNLVKLRKPKNLLERRILEKGYEPGEYAFFFTSGEGHFLRGDFGRMIVENYSGYLITMDPRIFSFWLDWDKNKKRNDLTNWEEVSFERRWQRSSEFRSAVRSIHLNPWNLH